MMKRIRRSLTLALFATVALVPQLASGARAAPVLPLAHSGRWITDAAGRVLIVHGVNMVYKLAPYYPAAVGFGDDDAAFLQSIGFNAVRVGVIWEALEPQPGVFDDAYLNQIAGTVSTLARHGIVSLLDFHQDLLNERFQGEGIPAWAVLDGGLPNPPLGFPGNYLANPALEHALDAFFANAAGPGGVGLQNRFATAWAHVAERFAGTRSVLGYEVFNEPFPGTLWQACAVPSGCPGFDGELSALYRRVIGAIRGVDRATLVWYEPNVLFNDGSATNLAPLGDRSLGFAFHDYCLTETPTSALGCDTFDDLVFAHANSRAVSNGDAVMETEFGATTNTAYLRDMISRADRYMTPWLEWAYCGCHDPTTTGPGNQQAIVIDPGHPPTGSNLMTATLQALVEPYPQLISGTPQRWSFDPATRTFALRFSTSRVGGGVFAAGAISEIAAPALVYGGRYAVQVTGGAVESRPGASLLQIGQCPGAGSVSVVVAPAGPTRSSCRLPPSWRHSRRS